MAKTIAERSARGELTRDELIDLYRLMLRIRRMEESVYQKFHEGKIGGYLHRYDGQEALVAGVIPQLRLPGDYVLCTYRDHAHALACGTEMRSIMAELLGRATGCAGGKGGSMHLINPDRGFLGGDGIVGGPVPISLGVGYALKYRGGDNICVCYFGDGAMNQGGVHEALNMVGLYKLPILYVLENNQYAMGTSVQRSTGQPDFVLKAKAHGIEGERVDGMNVLTMHEVARRAIERIRQTGEAYFLQADCYRFVGHGIGDDNTKGWMFYRTEEEVQKWRERDPILQLQKYLQEHSLISAEELDQIEQEARAEVADAIAFAENSPEPPLDSLYDHVYV
ncbi:MAG TPA: pyruvate dehydrogenase (acetyl-transferring) E1 component subunit alpha [Chthonomonas sp.]|uniref:pyruvate dehydrogenase (acetyl-transferring) E1 component subunit alpha n=1 Tax=Chthonomonas sp. TaxID=2282153 RepID=UPI002B4B8693|nr:pyruvate dehydrogenase (acetyl-transferring) E1 component subunit alpha [Chthonomonas sp.]HLI49217.1 pyruvate dehydrogenase (acetyl-transferring) E1 component subunit alpha [Chthonomonas sp.]